MKRILFNRGFASLLATQFFGAANDNILKQVLTFMVATGGLWEGDLGAGGQAYVALCLTLPFIFLSGFAGQVADRHSKRSVMMGVKIAEVPIACVALVGLLLPNLWVTMAAMLFLAIQSSFFGPAKYGVVPELVETGDLSRANGVLNMFTNVAIIMGIVIAGPVSDLYHPAPDPETGVVAEPMRWLPGVVLVFIALAGLAAIHLMPRLRAGDPELRYNYNPFATYVQSLKEMKGTPLLIVTFAWAFFYMVGIMALLILPEYKSLLALTYTKNVGLLGTLAISIGLGSLLAGLISGHHIRPRLIPIGAVGMTVLFVLLGIIRPEYWSVAGMLLVAGLFAGFYIVPLQALLQKLSPDAERGRFLGTANALSFVCSSLGAIVFWVAANPLRLPPNRIFLVCAVLAVLGTGYALIRLRGLLREHAKV